MEIEQNVWGFTPEGDAIIIYTMRNASGAEARMTNLGAAIVSLRVPDRAGRMADVLLGYSNAISYLNDGPFMGKIVGRYGNRIAYGRFTLDGKKYTVLRNMPPHQLHGGPQGFGNLLWQSRVEVNRVVMSLVSPAGDQGYPGELSVEVIYDWDDHNTLEITLLAKTDAPTVVNLTSHPYLNLHGEDSGRKITDHILKLNCSRYLPTDSTQIPTGDYEEVAGTPMDFTGGKEIGREIDSDFDAIKIGHGYDHCWTVGHWAKGDLREIGRLFDPESGRRLIFSSTQPGVQVYSGNFLEGAPEGKSGRFYGDREGVAIECQGFPDAPNHENFPSQRLDPEDIYQERIIYKFDVAESI